MARQLEEFNFGKMSRRSEYEKFLDGNIWELDLDDAPGTTSIRVMQTAINGTARRRDLKLRTKVVQSFDADGEPVDDEALIIVQAYKIDRDGNELDFDEEPEPDGDWFLFNTEKENGKDS